MINKHLKFVPWLQIKAEAGRLRKDVLLPALHLDTKQHTAWLISACGSQHLSLPVREIQH
jgi:hypothetical protein